MPTTWNAPRRLRSSQTFHVHVHAKVGSWVVQKTPHLKSLKHLITSLTFNPCVFVTSLCHTLNYAGHIVSGGTPLGSLGSQQPGRVLLLITPVFFTSRVNSLRRAGAIVAIATAQHPAVLLTPGNWYLFMVKGCGISDTLSCRPITIMWTSCSVNLQVTHLLSPSLKTATDQSNVSNCNYAQPVKHSAEAKLESPGAKIWHQWGVD